MAMTLQSPSLIEVLIRRRFTYAKPQWEPGKAGPGSKTGDPECSAAVSAWRRRQETPETHQTLALCRAKAAGKRAATLQRAAGQEGRAQTIEHRVATGKIGATRRSALAEVAKHKRMAAQLKRHVGKASELAIAAHEVEVDPVSAMRAIAERGREMTARAKEGRVVKLKPSTPEHKEAVKAVEKALEARHWAETAGKRGVPEEGQETLWAMNKESFKAAQGPLKAARQAETKDKVKVVEPKEDVSKSSEKSGVGWEIPQAYRGYRAPDAEEIARLDDVGALKTLREMTSEKLDNLESGAESRRIKGWTGKGPADFQREVGSLYARLYAIDSRLGELRQAETKGKVSVAEPKAEKPAEEKIAPATNSDIEAAHRRHAEYEGPDSFTPEIKAQAKAFENLPVGTRVVGRKGEVGTIEKGWSKPITDRDRPRKVNKVRWDNGLVKEVYPGYVEPVDESLSLTKFRKFTGELTAETVAPATNPDPIKEMQRRAAQLPRERMLEDLANQPNGLTAPMLRHGEGDEGILTKLVEEGRVLRHVDPISGTKYTLNRVYNLPAANVPKSLRHLTREGIEEARKAAAMGQRVLYAKGAW